ncbi:MAG: hypothetical protein V3U89_08875 [Methylophilaceae bacterium]
MTEATVKNSDKTELLDQMLEDLAGEEFDEHDYDFVGLDSGLDKFSEIDTFAEIDSYH